MNRSTIFEYLRNHTDLELRYTKRKTGSFPVLRIPFKWEHSYLLINTMRVTDFQALILYTNELVVRFSIHDDWQINIPYRDIECIEVREEMDIGYSKLYQGNVKYH